MLCGGRPPQLGLAGGFAGMRQRRCLRLPPGPAASPVRRRPVATDGCQGCSRSPAFCPGSFHERQNGGGGRGARVRKTLAAGQPRRPRWNNAPCLLLPQPFPPAAAGRRAARGPPPAACSLSPGPGEPPASGPLPAHHLPPSPPETAEKAPSASIRCFQSQKMGGGEKWKRKERTVRTAEGGGGHREKEPRRRRRREPRPAARRVGASCCPRPSLPTPPPVGAHREATNGRTNKRNDKCMFLPL